MNYSFRSRVAEITNRRGLDLNQLLNNICVNRHTFNSWANGHYPKVEVLIAIADELQVPADELLGLTYGKEQLQRALDDAKKAGCCTCRFGRSFNGCEYVCVRQEGEQFPRRNLSCWEWRGYAGTISDE